MTLRPTRRTRPLFLAAVVLVLEALLVLGLGVAEATQLRVSRWVVGAGASLLMLGYGAFLTAVACGVLRGRRWSRGPAVATQLLHLPIAWSFNGGSTRWVAWTLIAAALTVLVCLLLPSSTAILVDESEGKGEPEAGHPAG